MININCKNVILCLIFAFYSFLHSGNIFVEQLVSAGGLSQDWAWAVANDNQGNAFLAGSVAGYSTFGEFIVNGVEVSSPILTKISSEGVFEWVKYFPSNQPGTGMGVGTDSFGNIYISGYFSDSLFVENNILVSNGLWDVFLIKYDTNGNLLWFKNFGGSGYDIGHGLCVSDDDYVFITGWFGNSFYIEDLYIPNYGGSDIYIAKFDTEGNILNVYNSGNESVNYSYQISAGVNGAIAITGASSGELTLPYIGIVDFDSAYIYSIYSSQAEYAGYNVATGVSPYRVAIDSANNTYMVGKIVGQAHLGEFVFDQYNQTEDGLVAKSTPDGWEWAIPFHGSGTVVVRAVCVDSQDNVWIALTFTESLVFNHQIFSTESEDDLLIIKLNPFGVILDFLYIPCDGSIKPTDIKALNNGDIILTGWYSGVINIGNFSINSSNSYDRDIFYIRVSHTLSVEENLSINKNELPDINVYPNPLFNNCSLNISINNRNYNDLRYELFNIKGQRLLVLNSNKDFIPINIKDFQVEFIF